MTLLKELMESSNWEDDVYGINAITLINNKKIGIQGPVSYEEYVDEFEQHYLFMRRIRAIPEP